MDVPGQGCVVCHHPSGSRVRGDDFCSSGNRTAWGSLRVIAGIGGTAWLSSLFSDSALGACAIPYAIPYALPCVLPLKAEVRSKEGIKASEAAL